MIIFRIAVLILLATGFLPANAHEQSIAIDSHGVAVNGVNVSAVSKSGSRYTSTDKVRAVLGKPARVVQTKVDGQLDYWAGLSLFEDPEISLLSIGLRADGDEGRYRGSVTIEGVTLTPDTSITFLNASLDKGTFKEMSNLRSANHSLWDLTYPDFTVRVACDGKSKIKAIIVTPKPAK